MKRVGALGSAIGALAVLAVALASSCSSTEEIPPGVGGMLGATGGTSSSSGGTLAMPGGGTPGAGGSVVPASGGAGGANQPTGGTTVNPTGGATAGTTTGAGAGGAPTGGSSGAGGTVATGGVAAGGVAGGTPTGGGGSGAVAGGGGAPDAWWFDGPRPAPAPGSWPPPNITLTPVSMGTQPTAIAAPRADTTRLYFTEKWGVVRLIKDGVLLDEPALDIRAAVLEGGPQAGAELEHQGKRGLVGLAFHPDYQENGRMFVMYVADQGTQGVYGTPENQYDDGDMTFAEYRRSAADPDKFDPQPVDVFLQFDKGNCNQCNQHNGGSLEIDVDGFLWASTGDPPPYDDPGSQDPNNLNGKLLRFDISGSEVTAAGNYPGGEAHVASIGIRNTFKFSFDRYTGDMYVGDVGENTYEEVSVERYGDGNKNHGWPMREGLSAFQPTPCSAENCLDPVFDYVHGGPEGTVADNCIIGGYVYRGQAIPALQGAYIYGDNGVGKVRALQIQNGALMNPAPHEFAGVNVFLSCFGEDAAGEMYVCDYNEGRILRIAAQ